MGLYKPPTTSLKQFKHELDTVLCSIDVDVCLPLTLLGDCNIDILRDNHQAFLTYVHNKYKLQQHISTPTTLTGTSIVLVFSNLPDINAYALVIMWSTHHPLVGLSFLFIEMKELCEARAKLEMSSNLADEPTLANVLIPSLPSPHLKLLDEKVTATCFHTINENPFETVIWWESDRWCPPPCETASENDLTLCISILSMRTHSKQSFDEKLTGDVLPPPFETARAQSDLFTV